MIFCIPKFSDMLHELTASNQCRKKKETCILVMISEAEHKMAAEEGEFFELIRKSSVVEAPCLAVSKIKFELSVRDLNSALCSQH